MVTLAHQHRLIQKFNHWLLIYTWHSIDDELRTATMLEF